jgi:3-methylcrotonyl-CoA carboxylase alpha subunit
MRLLHGDQWHETVVRSGREGLEVGVDGTWRAVTLDEIAPGTYVFHEGDRAETFHCVRDGDLVHVFWRGVTYRLRLEKDGVRSVARGAASGLEAPMPGKVIKLGAAVGQQVTKGQEILVVEAMKMENAIRAPRDGSVKRIAVKVGDMVAPGVVLVELE